MKFSVPRTLEGPQREIAECRVLCECVDAFAKDMKAKLCSKAVKGWREWDNPKHETAMAQEMFRIADVHGQEVDVANFAMFLWNLSQE